MRGFYTIQKCGGGVLRDMLDYISTRYGIKTFDFGFNTPKQNNFIPLLTELPENEWIIEKEESFNVMLPYTFESFEEYFKTLSKSTRQNYRTAINRLRKDGKSFSFDFYENEIPEIEMNNFLKDHKERLSNRYLNNRSAIVEKTLEPARRLIYGKYRRDGIAALSMKKGNNQILAVMKIDNKNAAYYYGLISESSEMKRINFFRVCVNDTEFGFYSPGMILGMEIIKKYQAEFSIYDFTKGDESYKYKFGCQNEDDFFVRIKRK